MSGLWGLNKSRNYMHDLVAGRYWLPWEAQVRVSDGTSCGFPAPTRTYGEPASEPADAADAVADVKEVI